MLDPLAQPERERLSLSRQVWEFRGHAPWRSAQPASIDRPGAVDIMFVLLLFAAGESVVHYGRPLSYLPIFP